jgi:HTH-type transcriptional regulator/antitoxin HigA
MEVFPIRTEADHRAALKEVERLWDAVPGTPEADRMDVLFTLVEAYEALHQPIPPPDPIEAVLYHIESRGISPQDLVPFIGSRGRVSEVLNRKRSLTLPMIRRLHMELGIPADVLIQSYPISQPERTRSQRKTVRSG